jgi:hypothetical protein
MPRPGSSLQTTAQHNGGPEWAAEQTTEEATVDRYAMTCPCSCHGRGQYAQCDDRYPSGCGHLHGAASGTGCPACSRPTADHALCPTCTLQLARDLAQVPELAEELETTRTKQDRIGNPSDGRGGGHVPLGYRPTAAEVGAVLHDTLAVWARELAAATGAPLYAVPAEHPVMLAAWLAENCEAARHLALAGQLADEVSYAVRVTRRAIDRPLDRVYVGPCDDCSADLYALPHHERLACRECAAEYLVSARRAWLLDSLREHLATAAEIAAGMGELYGQTVNRKTINVWHHRGRLVEHASTRTGWPLFRIGDVLDLCASGQQPATHLAGAS